jgi:hypothetical protein
LLGIVLVLSAAGCRQIFGLEPPLNGDGSGNVDAPFDPDPDTSPTIDSNNALDTDGDGVTNTTDNCPSLPNSNQADEESDGVGDVCDKCPISTSNTDGDADGVGDACDPHPSTGGDVIALFEPFRTMPTSWTQDGGTWTVANGALFGGAATGNQGGIFLAGYSTKQTVSTSVTMTNALGNGFRIAGIKDNAAIGGFAVVCSMMITPNSDNPPNEPMNNLYEQPAGTFYERVSFAWTLNNPMVIRSVRNGTNYDCYGTQNALTSVTNAIEGTVTLTPKIGLHVQSAAVRFDWLLVVTSP